jgi:hypothetical protein
MIDPFLLQNNLAHAFYDPARHQMRHLHCRIWRKALGKIAQFVPCAAWR